MEGYLGRKCVDVCPTERSDTLYKQYAHYLPGYRMYRRLTKSHLRHMYIYHYSLGVQCYLYFCQTHVNLI